MPKGQVTPAGSAGDGKFKAHSSCKQAGVFFNNGLGRITWEQEDKAVIDHRLRGAIEAAREAYYQYLKNPTP